MENKHELIILVASVTNLIATYLQVFINTYVKLIIINNKQ
jgi:hypothetical protein